MTLGPVSDGGGQRDEPGGPKRLNADNFVRPDPTISIFRRLTAGVPIPLTPELIAGDLAGLELHHRVPGQIAEMYLVSVGVMFYGAFFYPLFQLGEQQLFRVCDAAVKVRARELRLPGRTFEKRIDALAAHGTIAVEDAVRWHALRDLRNESSHADFVFVGAPGQAIGTAKHVAALLDSLWSGRPD